jgi:hypothetical protein
VEILFNNSGTYETKDWAWLTATFGPGLKLLDAGNVDKFALVKIVVTQAEASLNAHLTDENGQPAAGVYVGRSYPSLANPDPGLQDLSGGGLKTMWSKRAVVQKTDANGQTGFGMGTGDYIKDLSIGGPDTVWVCSPSTASDGLTGIGMLGGTVHECPTHLYFQFTKAGSVTPPVNPPPTPAEGTLRALLTAAQGDMTAISAAVADYQAKISRALELLG